MKLQYLLYIVLIGFISGACDAESSGDSAGSDSGVGGSTARFTVVGDYLYTVNSETMRTFDVSDATSPTFVNETRIGSGIETIFPYGKALFLGTQTGMYIYDVSLPTTPQKLSFYEHVFSCDPVVVSDSLAFVTLNSLNTWCGWQNNELHIIDVSDLRKPSLIKRYSMESPYGLGVKGDNLFLCDNGLKLYDVSDPTYIQLLYHFSIPANDVIPLDDIVIVTADDGIYQYSYNSGELTLLSKISVDYSQNTEDTQL